MTRIEGSRIGFCHTSHYPRCTRQFASALAIIARYARIPSTLSTFFLAICIFAAPSLWAADIVGWFPAQKAPKAIVCATAPHGDRVAAESMLLQSIAGLAALAVNEGTLDELVWVETDNADYRDWKRRTVARLQLDERGTYSAWDLVDRLLAKGAIEGYILYRADKSAENKEQNGYRLGMDMSVNVATSVAGVLRGVIVEEIDEETARNHGLTLILDARDKTQQWTFEEYRDRFNRRMLCTQDPANSNVRDLAIAHRVFTLYGNDPSVEEAMRWMEPLSPILGWNGGDEGQTTTTSSNYGHIQTATDWCMNLPVLMSGAAEADTPPFDSFDPANISYESTQSTISFVLSDGDNVQWAMGGFARGQENSWWADSTRGRSPFGWSVCLAHLAQLCPDAITYLHETRTPADTLIEWGGGYFYPDLLGKNRPDRDAILASQARRTWALMQKTNTRVIGFNFMNFDSKDARHACEIYAREMDELSGILAFEYHAYEGGSGKAYWVKNKHGIDIPVVSARYAIWENLHRPRAGSPAKVAREIMQTVRSAKDKNSSPLDWAIVHCWSYFRHSDGTDEEAENLPQEEALQNGGVRGYTPAMWCMDRLSAPVRVVSIEEMLWLTRMRHDPIGTQALLKSANESP